MTIYKTEGRIYAPKTDGDTEKGSTQASQPLQSQRCGECVNGECREPNCDCRCDCEAQDGAPPLVLRRQSRPCSTLSLAAICTVTVGLSVLLIGLLFMATKGEFHTRPRAFCTVMYPPDHLSNETYPETISVEEDEEIELFDVPKFDNNHHLTIMTDFKIQMTAFRDNEDNSCFLMNHSNSLFESPRNILEFMRDYRNGDHLTQLDTVYARMEVQGPAVNMTIMASNIQTHCFQQSTFWLQLSETGTLVKRSADNAAKRSFIFFNGKSRVHIDVDQ